MFVGVVVSRILRLCNVGGVVGGVVGGGVVGVL